MDIYLCNISVIILTIPTPDFLIYIIYIFINIPTNAFISSTKLILKLLRHVSVFLHHLQEAYRL